VRIAHTREFARGVDVLTVEIEHVDADALAAVQRELGVDVEPTPGTLRLIQVRRAAIEQARRRR
jgi:phosphoribosylaminoimidazole carboxylase